MDSNSQIALYYKDPYKFNKMKRIKRFYQRFYNGRALDGYYQLTTLTTNDNDDSDIHRYWRLFKWRIRKSKYPNTLKDYICIKEFNKKRTCQHLHIASRDTYLNYNFLHELWNQTTNARWIHVDKITNPKGMVMYLAKYMIKSIEDSHNHAYWCSRNWLYNGAQEYHKTMYKLGTSVTTTEDQLIHDLEVEQRYIWKVDRILTQIREMPKYNQTITIGII